MERGMECVLAVYEHRNFTKAAAALFITQPALSTLVKKEEQRYGVTFFDRKKLPLSLTPAGESYIRTALKIRHLEENLAKAMRSFRSVKNDQFKVGGAAYFCGNVLPDLTAKFQKEYPDVGEVVIQEGNSPELLEALGKGELDALLSVDQYTGKKWGYVPMGEEMLILAVPAVFPVNEKIRDKALSWQDIRDGRQWQKNCPEVSLSFFGKTPFVLLCKGNNAYTRSRKMFRNAGIRPPIVMQMDQMLTSYFLALDGKGAVILRSDLILTMEPTDRVLYYKIADPLSVRPVKLYYKMQHSKSPVLEAFLNFCQQQGKKFGEK